MAVHETVEERLVPVRAAVAPVPGLVLVFSAGRPVCKVVPVPPGGALELGRDPGVTLPLDDERASRRHARVTWAEGAFGVEDLRSRNGTWLDGVRVEGARGAGRGGVLRVGWSLALLLPDVGPYLRRGGVAVEEGTGGAGGGGGGQVLGPALAEAWERVARAARTGTALLLTGESGTGKELAARAFHAAGPRPQGPFVSVNSATLPEGVAERLLFGARKGAYSGATESAEGLVQAADGGTLFLDELAELSLEVQAKLLRVLETREVLPLGASRPVAVDFRVVSATLRDVRARVAEGRFREDLYFRLGRPEVHLPPLRERREEVPWLVVRELDAVGGGMTAHVSLVESCLLRPWPGNVRELQGEVRRAAREAADRGRALLEADDLDARAGLGLAATPRVAGATPVPLGTGAGAARGTGALPPDDVIEAALGRNAGNVTRTARELGLHRNQLRRWLARRDGDEGEADEADADP